MEILTSALRKEHRDAGLYLEEDVEGFIYLKRGDKVLKTWHGRTATVEEVWIEADKNMCPLEEELVNRL